eukprot:CAMPEP_0197561678 /NCGR_PEP_ID=MMETSP1320-20131121/25623_1 /TAXON_ID=91990 /ORGANISM="Bolidomonas sp., Strain RCC2347" /LENGTH=70 /DNA_ID=CAMNT_0043123353 /DNA_START=184 /DNA_END=392 /DNA_ORIENTATION=-
MLATPETIVTVRGEGIGYLEGAQRCMAKGGLEDCGEGGQVVVVRELCLMRLEMKSREDAQECLISTKIRG